jgi:hypothetical protein
MDRQRILKTAQTAYQDIVFTLECEDMRPEDAARIATRTSEVLLCLLAKHNGYNWTIEDGHPRILDPDGRPMLPL